MRVLKAAQQGRGIVTDSAAIAGLVRLTLIGRPRAGNDISEIRDKNDG